jgi:hypothetical protein
LAERGRIRTSDTVLPVYRTEVRRFRPLSHLSLCRKERRRLLCRKSIGAPGDDVESCSIPTVP